MLSTEIAEVIYNEAILTCFGFLVVVPAFVFGCKSTERANDENSNVKSTIGSGATEFVYYKGNGANLHFPGNDITDGGRVDFCSEGNCTELNYNAGNGRVNIFRKDTKCATLRIIERAPR